MDHPYLNVSDPAFTRHIHHVTYGVVAPLLVSTGIAGNLVCLPCLAAPARWGVTRLILVVLSSVDLAIMVCLIPTLVRLARPTAVLAHYALTWYAAHVEQWLLAATTGGSICTVLVLTIDRYISVCRGVSFQKQHRHDVAIRRIAISSTVVVLVAVAAIFRGTAQPSGESWIVHQSDTAGWKGYVIFSECLTRFLPMATLMVLNWRIAVGFRQMMSRAAARAPRPITLPRETSVASMSHRPPKEAEERALVKLVIAIMVWLLVCLLPGTVVTICLLYIKTPSHALDIALAVANLLEVANFSTNYIFYMVFNKRLRRSLVSFYTQLLKKDEDPISVNT